jgi:cobalt-zinc-cadmium efflux system outer membrane protein
LLVTSFDTYAQSSTNTNELDDTGIIKLSPVIARYYDSEKGISAINLVQQALANNGEIAAARLDIERNRAKLLQAGLRPNPSLSFEQTTERLTGTGDDRETSITFYLPFELGGKRRRRMELAESEIAVAEAEVASRERRLAADVLAIYVEALAALRELQIIENLNNINSQTGQLVEARVKEGDTAPVEMNLLKVQVDRMRVKQVLIESRLQSSLMRLKGIIGMSPSETLRLRETIDSPLLPKPPNTLETAIDVAMQTRPELKLARQNEELAKASLRLAQAQAIPDIIPFTKYSFDRTVTDLPSPLIAIPNRSRLLTFGFSIGLPIFNKNQGVKAETVIAISQAQRRREYLEATVRIEVTNAYERYQAVQMALKIFEEGVITRSNKNIQSMRTAYQLGGFSLAELLTEQRQLLDAQREFIEALTENYRAIVDLQAAMGIAIDHQ